MLWQVQTFIPIQYTPPYFVCKCIQYIPVHNVSLRIRALFATLEHTGMGIISKKEVASVGIRCRRPAHKRFQRMAREESLKRQKFVSIPDILDELSQKKL